MICEGEAIMGANSGSRVMVAAGVAAATLGACGGGGGGQAGVVRPSTPAPVFATAATPTLAQSLGTAVPLAGNAVTVTTAAGTTTVASRNDVSSARTIDSASQVTLRFSVAGTERTAILDPSAPPPIGGPSNGVGVPVLTAQHADGTVFNADSNAGTLDYASFGYWSFQPTNAQGAATGPAVMQSYSGGRETPLTNIPTAGTATYTGRTLGFGTSAGTSFFMAGNVLLNADFAVNSRTVNGTIAGITTSPLGATTLDSIVLSGGTISGNGFAGTATAFNGGLTLGSGPFAGKFFGPTAGEVAGQWSFQNPVGSPAINAVGSFGAKAP